MEVSHVARVDRIFDLKFLTHHHMAWSRHLHPLGVEAGDCREERTYQYQSLHICLVSSLPVFVQLSLVGLAHGLFQPLLRLLLLQHGRIEQLLSVLPAHLVLILLLLLLLVLLLLVLLFILVLFLILILVLVLLVLVLLLVLLLLLLLLEQPLHCT